MITKIKKNSPAIFTAILSSVLLLSSCKKEISTNSTETAASTIAVAASQVEARTSAGAVDSVYVLQPCQRGSQRKAIAEADLPASVSAYLSASYAGYAFNKAFKVVNSSGTTNAFVVVIFFNDKPVAILFDSNGNFVKILEQREKGDLNGRGWHDGGRFCDRNGLQKDSIAITALGSSILNYLSANFPQDTLLKAFKNKHDSSIIVISKNNGVFATVFDAKGNFKKRISLPAPSGYCISIAQTALATKILDYLNTTYPNYIFEKAFAGYKNNVVQGYLVIINANNTKYAVHFDATGNFVSVKTIW